LLSTGQSAWISLKGLFRDGCHAVDTFVLVKLLFQSSRIEGLDTWPVCIPTGVLSIVVTLVTSEAVSYVGPETTHSLSAILAQTDNNEAIFVFVIVCLPRQTVHELRIHWSCLEISLID
jgi:hypothetical protein